MWADSNDQLGAVHVNVNMLLFVNATCGQNDYMNSSIESQKGVITDQRCSVENQKGAIAIDFVQR